MMNLLVTLDAGYVGPLRVMLASLMAAEPEESFTLYVAHSRMGEEDFRRIRSAVDPARCTVAEIRVSDETLSDAPIVYRYPREMYYRLFAACFLPPELDRVLYLDPDTVVIGRLRELYELEMGESLYAAASHVHEQFRKFNEVRLGMPENAPYVNSGVVLMNLPCLRAEQDVREVLAYIERKKPFLLLPDQDVMNALYGDRILPIDPLLYNLDEKYWNLYNLNPKNRGNRRTLNWVRENTRVVHFCGRNKPWKPGYHGEFRVFYDEAARLLPPEPPAEETPQKREITEEQKKEC